MKRSFFQAAVVSILLYGCTTWRQLWEDEIYLLFGSILLKFVPSVLLWARPALVPFKEVIYNETRTHLWRFARFASKPLHHPRGLDLFRRNWGPLLLNLYTGRYIDIYFCCILAFDPAKNAIPRWCTGRRWHILMAVMRGNRVGGNWLMKWDEVKIPMVHS